MSGFVERGGCSWSPVRAAAWVGLLLGLGLLPSCTPQLSVSPNARVIGARARVRVWLLTFHTGDVTVSCSGSLVTPAPEFPDLGVNPKTAAATPQTVMNLGFPRTVDFELPEADGQQLFPGSWNFVIEFRSNNQVVDRRTCDGVTLLEGQTQELKVFEGFEGCSATPDFGTFPWERQHDVAVTQLLLDPVAPPVGSRPNVRITVENQGASAETGVALEVNAAGNALGTPPVDLPASGDPGASMVISVPWNTAGLQQGVPYSVTARIPPIPGEIGTHPRTEVPFDNTGNNSQPALSVTLGPADADADGVPDATDNCNQPNTDQKDSDGDGVGDVCDNCDFVLNPAQADGNTNGIGDECDLKIHGFLVPNVTTPWCPAAGAPCTLIASGDCTVPTTITPGVAGCVFLFGEGFLAGTTQVSVGGTTLAATDVLVCGPTRLTFLGPAPSANAALLSRNGVDTATSPIAYCPSTPPACPGLRALTFSPIGGERGTKVYVFGCGFGNQTAPLPAVRIGAVTVAAANVERITDKILSFIVPPTAVSASIFVTVGGTTVSPPRVFQVVLN